MMFDNTELYDLRKDNAKLSAIINELKAQNARLEAERDALDAQCQSLLGDVVKFAEVERERDGFLMGERNAMDAISMTPIEAALRKVRELREAEKQMTPRGWQQQVYEEQESTELVIHNHQVVIKCTTPEDAHGVTALLNAAEPMLALLEVLLIERHVLGVANPDEHTTVNRALAAFVKETKEE